MSFNQTATKEHLPQDLRVVEAASISATNYIYEQSHLKGYKTGWEAGWAAAFASNTKVTTTENEEEEEGERIELELSKEWMEFFSRQHETKNARTKSNDKDNILQELPDFGGVAQRERVMKMEGIYGEKVSKDLCAKEALLSTHFDKHVALLDAQLWPQLPILGAEGPSVIMKE